MKVNLYKTFWELDVVDEQKPEICYVERNGDNVQ